MPRPLAFHEILIVAGRDDVAPLEVGFVNPILVLQDVVFAATAKTAI